MCYYILKKTGQICERCLPEKDGGKRQEKNGSAEEKTPHRWWRCKYNNYNVYQFHFIHVVDSTRGQSLLGAQGGQTFYTG